ncbi:hypothetical protein [Kitasatospora sp. MAP5-34]|nr:hypothetical protein [Kitasatospora sp. MAP5-34]MDH6580276.1 hypothetical protein [Kitasatospora sp. MAP5-34]
MGRSPQRGPALRIEPARLEEERRLNTILVPPLDERTGANSCRPT